MPTTASAVNPAWVRTEDPHAPYDDPILKARELNRYYWENGEEAKLVALTVFGEVMKAHPDLTDELIDAFRGPKGPF